MHELRRLAYLDAMGVDSYVSRGQLPGAAVTNRLAVVRESAPEGLSARGAEQAPTPAPVVKMPRVDVRPPVTPAHELATQGPAETLPPQDANVPRFSLAAIVAGPWLWLEELGDIPLTVEQVRLVRSMAQALCRAGNVATPVDRPEVMQFDWPIHTNRQLDLGEAAASAAVAAFVGRQVEQFGCRGLVLLGESCAGRVPMQETHVLTARTVSSVELLSNPVLKPRAWRELLPLLRPV